MRVAIIHYWIVAERGGEKVVRALCDMFPGAVLYTHVADAALAARLFPGHEIRTTFIARLPFAQRFYQRYLPLMPLALEELDLGEFDLVISSEAGPAKGVIPHPTAFHLCYCHSPMRYVWDQQRHYRDRAGPLAKLAFPAVAHYLRQWDAASSARVDEFVANSRFVAARINKYYRRPAEVVHPPVEVAPLLATPRASREAREDSYLWVGQLAPYKNPELALDAFAHLGKNLVVIGEGELAKKLRRTAGARVRFLGRADDDAVRRAYASCRALIFPTEEDFGMTPVEAMAAGMPVIALNRGGATETVVHRETGVLFGEPSVESLVSAVRMFEEIEADFDPQRIKRHAAQFGPAQFHDGMRRIFHRRGIETAPLREPRQAVTAP